MSNIIVLTPKEELKNQINQMIKEEYPEKTKKILNLEELRVAMEYQFVTRFADIVVIDSNYYDIEKCHRIKFLTPHTLLIYLTDNLDYGKFANVEPYKVVPIDKLQKAIHDAIYRINRTAPIYFVYHKNKNVIKVDSRKIMYFWSDKRRKYFKLEGGGTDYFYEEMDDLEKRINNFVFARVSKSYIVNPKYITDIINDEIKMIDGTLIKHSRNWQSLLKF